MFQVRCTTCVVTESKGAVGFQKGQSGNPGGRPKAERDVRAAMMAQLPQRMAKLAALCAHKNPQTALRALELWLGYAIGKPRQAVELSGIDGGPIEHADVSALRAGLLARVAAAAEAGADEAAGAGEPH